MTIFDDEKNPGPVPTDNSLPRAPIAVRDDGPPPDTDPSRSAGRWVLALASVASFMVSLDLLAISTALSTIRLDLGASLEQLEWTVNSFNLALAVTLIPAAALGDRFGRRRLFAAGLAVFTVASVACAIAPDVGWLIAARAAQGVGAAFVLALALALVGAGYPPQRRGAAIGILEGITGLALIAGPVVGGAITATIGWEWIFWLNVPIGLVVIVLVLRRTGESHGADTALDIPGFALVTAAVFALVWGLVRSHTAGWTSVEVLGSLLAGVVLVVVFVVWERRAREPMLPIGLFRIRAFSAGNAATFLPFASTLATVFFLAQFLQAGQGYDPLGAGLRLLPWTAALVFVAPLAGLLTDRVGARPVAVTGLALQTVAMGWIALIATPDVAYGILVVPLVVGGIGGSMAIPSVQAAVIGAVPADMLGKAAGVNVFMRQLGGVFGIAALVAVFAAVGSYDSPAEFSAGFAAAMWLSAAFSLAGAIAALGLHGRRARTEKPPIRIQIERKNLR